MIRRLFLIIMFVSSVVDALEDEYEELGCYEDSPQSRAISGKYLEFETETILESCFQMAKRRGFDVFGIEQGTHCYSSDTAYTTYNKHGRSDYCNSGRGGILALNIYQLRPTGSFLIVKMRLMAKEGERKEEVIEKLEQSLETKTVEIRNLTKRLRNVDADVSQLKTTSMQVHNDIKKMNTSIKIVSANISQGIKKLHDVHNHDIKDLNNNISDILAKMVHHLHLPSGPFYYPKGTTHHVAFDEYTKYGAKFEGFSNPLCANWTGGQHMWAVENCAEKCYFYYSTDQSYKHFNFGSGSGFCLCCKGRMSDPTPDIDRLTYQFV